MAYKKYTWKKGDPITAEKLNHIEDGIANIPGGENTGSTNSTGNSNTNNTNTFIVTLEEDEQNEGTYIANKTIAETIAAYESGATCICQFPTNFGSADMIVNAELFTCVSEFNALMFSATSNFGTDDGVFQYTVMAISDGGSDEWTITSAIVETGSSGSSSSSSSSIPELEGKLSDANKIIKVDNQGEEYILATNPAPFIIYITHYDEGMKYSENSIFTSESIIDILTAYEEKKSLELYIDNTSQNAFPYQKNLIKCQIEKICYIPEDEDVAYKFVFSYYDENETTKRKYITMSGYPSSNYSRYSASV